MAVIVFGIACVAQLADTARRFLGDESDPVVGVATAPPPRPLSAEAIAAAHLFGAPAPTAAAVAAPADDALTLTGTIAFGAPATGFALVKTADAARLYRVGEQVAAGVQLLEVHADAIVVSRNGARQVYALPRTFGPGVNDARDARYAAAFGPGGTGTWPSTRALEAGRKSAERRAAERARELAAAPDADVRPEPVVPIPDFRVPENSPVKPSARAIEASRRSAERRAAARARELAREAGGG